MKYSTTNDELVAYLKKQEIISNPTVLEAFRAVDRGDFATPNLRQVAYENRPVQHGDIHLSAPFIYAEALEELRLKPGMSFLNIGSGTGYLSYLVSMLIGEMGVNHGVELSPVLLKHSAQCIAMTDQKLGRKTDIQVIQGNGMGISTDSGYDCVYVGAGCNPDKTMDYLKGLLNVGGILVAPFGEELVRMERTVDGSFSTRTLCDVVFSPIVMPPPPPKVTENKGGEAVAEEPPAIRFKVRPWSPACHSVYPEAFRNAVKTVLLANNREDTMPSVIPATVWMEIMSFARRDWFSRSERVGVTGAGQGAAGKAGPISQGCLGAAKSMALIPVKAGSAAATQIGCHVS